MSWDLSNIVLSDEQRSLASDLEQWLMNHPSNLAQAIISLQGGVFDRKEMQILELAIFQEFRPFKQAIALLRLLCKIVDFINLNTANVLPNPRVPNLRVRPVNPFHGDVPTALKRVRQWREAMTENLVESESQIVHANNEIHLGQLLASAILHGGLLDAALLVAFVQALFTPPNRFFVMHGRLSVDLSIAWQGEAGSEHRIWYADAMTASLIAKMPGGLVSNVVKSIDPSAVSDEQLRQIIWHCISQYFKIIDLQKLNSSRPKSLKVMLTCVLLDLQTRLPMVLANFAARKLISHSPPANVIARLNGLQSFKELSREANIELEDKSDSQFSQEVTRFNQTANNLDEIEPLWLADLRAVFNPPHPTSASQKLELLKQTRLSGIASCFVGFADRLIHANSASGHKLAISTAKAYLITVAKRLGGRLGNESPATFDSETLENLYIEILEDADQASGQKKHRRFIARALREFHYYLVYEYKIDPINAREVLGHGKGLTPVDANLIQLDEYSRIFDALPQAVKELHPTLPAQQRLGYVAQLIFMLAFKSGLRRMEVLKLKIQDFSDAEPAELLIRPSVARRLKTKSSTRKLPLYALLSHDELTLLNTWKKTRLAEIPVNVPQQDQFLFGIPELTPEFIPQELIFPIIHYSMRSVTQDASLRFHHLRHSFACWTFMRLMLADLPAIPNIFSLQPKTQQYLKDSKSFRNRLYGQSGLTRKHVYALASLLGHSGPEISLEHYIHCCDVLLAVWQDVDVSAPNIQVISKQLSLSTSTSYRWKRLGRHHTPYRLLKQRWPVLVKNKKIQTTDPLDSTVLPDALLQLLGDSEILTKLHYMLYQHGVNNTAIEELANQLGLPEVFALSVYQHMHAISSMQTSRGKMGYRHRMIEMKLDRREKDKVTRLVCPVAPQKAEDKHIEKVLTPKLLSTMKSHPLLCSQVFDYYLNNAWQTSNEVIFKNPNQPEDAIQFIEFLNLLGIKKSMLRFTSFNHANKSPEFDQWKIQLGLNAHHHIKKINPPNITKTTKLWIGIKPIIFDKHQLSQKSGAETGSIAFRYLMVMGAATLRYAMASF